MVIPRPLVEGLKVPASAIGTKPNQSVNLRRDASSSKRPGRVRDVRDDLQAQTSSTSACSPPLPNAIEIRYLALPLVESVFLRADHCGRDAHHSCWFGLKL